MECCSWSRKGGEGSTANISPEAQREMWILGVFLGKKGKKAQVLWFSPAPFLNVFCTAGVFFGCFVNKISFCFCCSPRGSPCSVLVQLWHDAARVYCFITASPAAVRAFITISSAALGGKSGAGAAHLGEGWDRAAQGCSAGVWDLSAVRRPLTNTRGHKKTFRSLWRLLEWAEWS